MDVVPRRPDAGQPGPDESRAEPDVDEQAEPVGLEERAVPALPLARHLNRAGMSPPSRVRDVMSERVLYPILILRRNGSRSVFRLSAPPHCWYPESTVVAQEDERHGRQKTILIVDDDRELVDGLRTCSSGRATG